MAVAIDCLGLTEPGDGLIPAAEDREDEGRGGGARGRAGRGAGPGRADGARRFLDRRALRNAMAGIAASGGSTNGVLHLLAVAREAGVELTQDELTELASAHAGAREPLARRPPRRRDVPPRGRRRGR